MESLSFSEAARLLSRFGIKQHHLYFIDLVLLCEMAWADGKIQVAEREILFHYLGRHVESINRLAGCTVVTGEDAKEFVCRFLDRRPDPALCSAIQGAIPAIRLNHSEPEEKERTRLGILNACLDIAASSVTKYPYGLTERFTQEEKQYYHTIEKILTGAVRNRD